MEEEQEEEDDEEEASEESLTELKEKLEEEETEKGGGGSPHQLFKSREQLMLRANSLKKAVRQIIEQAERGNAGFCEDKGRNPERGCTAHALCVRM